MEKVPPPPLAVKVIAHLCRGRGRGVEGMGEKVKDDDISLKFGHLFGKADRQTDKPTD